LVEFLYTRGIGGPVEQNLVLETESIMLSAPLPPEKQAEVDDLARAIREAVDAEINELAANLATADDAHVFGDNEFRIRALAHKIAAKAIEQRLAQKKRIPRRQRDLPALRPDGRVPLAPHPHPPEPRRSRLLPARLLSVPALWSGDLPLR
jgi:hypothetical protein